MLHDLPEHDPAFLRLEREDLTEPAGPENDPEPFDEFSGPAVPNGALLRTAPLADPLSAHANDLTRAAAELVAWAKLATHVLKGFHCLSTAREGVAIIDRVERLLDAVEALGEVER